MSTRSPHYTGSSQDDTMRPKSPKPLSQPPPNLSMQTEIDLLPSSQPLPSESQHPLVASASPMPSSAQPLPDELARDNIKVRDFAFESVLPVIPSIKRRRRISNAARPLKRPKRWHNDNQDLIQEGVELPTAGIAFNTQIQTGEQLKGKGKLERKSTEPDVAPDKSDRRPARGLGFTDLSECDAFGDSQVAQTSAPTQMQGSRPSQPSLHYWPERALEPSQRIKFGPNALVSSQPPLVDDSQDTEPLIDTPLLTPHGSHRFEVSDTSAIPLSQLDAELERHVPEDVTLSQLGFSPERSQFDELPQAVASVPSNGIEHPTTPTPKPRGLKLIAPGGSLSALSPMSSLTSLALSPRAENRPLPIAPTPSPPVAASSRPKASPRYFLRRRAASPSRNEAPAAPTRHRSTRKTGKTSTVPFPRLPAASRQSAHSRTPKASKLSPRARPLKRTAV
ncbi:hypothetical protein EVG20_g1024 [Dentipellis fragilis]|uniref:Uncharacterized protein n=1 Tax=Dentipellis fragilis TaxID=205917 RepID=A0A4Y9ZDU3_9AGAM|nr:hypothetical protein EVG20_g1024 [Dentipellis fragilis]